MSPRCRSFRPFLCALALCSLAQCASILAVPARGASALDAAEIDNIANLVRLGRMLEAQSLLQGRVPHIALGEVGTRFGRALTFLPLARATQDRALTRAIQAVLREDGAQLVTWAGRSGSSPRRLRQISDALTCLTMLPDADSGTKYRIGWCRHELGELAQAKADLTEALALDPMNDSARWLLARTSWRLGDRRPALELVVTGLKSTPDREGSELLAGMLRYSKRKGRAGAARTLAERWAAELQPDDASPLHGVVAEIKLEDDDLPGAMDSFAKTAGPDRPWLLGGIVRAARAEAAKGAAQRESVVQAIGRVPLENAVMPAPLMKLAGDIAMTQKEPGRALRHYAASVTLGEDEAREVARHARGNAGAAMEPGAMAAILSGHEFATAPQKSEPGLASPFSPGGLLFDGASPMVDLDDEQTQRRLGLMSRGSAGSRAHNALEIMKRTDLPRNVALQMAVRQATPVPARAAMVRAYLDGDVAGTKESLDAFSLVSWQVLRPGVVGMIRQAPSGSGTTNVEPVKEPDSKPPALEAVGQALEALKDPTTDEESRLTRIMEVAGQRTPQTERLGDPVVIDMDGNGQIDISSRDNPEGSATFDLDGWGNARQVQWIQAGRDGWLCEDVNRDGQISNGNELFGTAGGYTDGFEKLALRDSNGDGRVAGAELAGLSIWREARNPGVVDPGELVSVEEAGVTAVSIPRVGLRTTATVHGEIRLCVEVWPEAIRPEVQAGLGGDLDLEGI